MGGGKIRMKGKEGRVGERSRRERGGQRRKRRAEDGAGAKEGAGRAALGDNADLQDADESALQ
eukprot:6197250-Pleurochrysis_carterae.AAC.3